MTSGQIFTSRLKGRPLLDTDGMAIGRIRDVVILPGPGKEPPRALGLVVLLQRRRIFVNLAQIAEISVDGAHLTGGTVDLDRFTQRTGESMASELYGKHTDDGTIVDVAICPSEQQRVGWEVCALAVSHGLSLLHRNPEIVPWDRYPELFKTDPVAEQLAALRELPPADLATAVEGLPQTRRDQVAAALDDEELADLLEEMQPDDAADLLAEMPAEHRERLLTAMKAVQADDLRRLLRYGPNTAGGLMTSQPLIVTPDTPVAEILARIRNPDMPVTSAAQVYVCEPPMVTPTGRYLGTVGFQRLLRRSPSVLAGECVETRTFVRPDLPERDLAAKLAAYNLVSVAVCDEDGRLLGAVTVDDVLDHLLPANWRRTGG
jgi:CBS domain-containing protein